MRRATRTRAATPPRSQWNNYERGGGSGRKRKTDKGRPRSQSAKPRLDFGSGTSPSRKRSPYRLETREYERKRKTRSAGAAKRRYIAFDEHGLSSNAMASSPGWAPDWIGATTPRGGGSTGWGGGASVPGSGAGRRSSSRSAGSHFDGMVTPGRRAWPLTPTNRCARGWVGGRVGAFLFSLEKGGRGVVALNDLPSACAVVVVAI